MNKCELLNTIGCSCRAWRKSTDYSVKQICEETGYCPASVSLFETGGNNNAILFMWYIAHGFDAEKDYIVDHKKMTANDVFYKYYDKGE